MKSIITKQFYIILGLLFITNIGFSQADAFSAHLSTEPVLIDGIANETIWDVSDWYEIKHVWIPYGQTVSVSDFTGKFKIAWDENYVYFLVEIFDDSLYDGHIEPTDQYWNDDCVEIFLDEDNSGGNHQYNFNAFAYHVSTLLETVDFNASGPATFNNDVDVAITNNQDTYTWELAVKIFADDYVYNGSNTPVGLNHGKKIGFSMAYCDNDGSTNRENFIGSKYLSQSQADLGYINADVFGTLTLIDSTHVTAVNGVKLTNSVYPTFVKENLTVKLNNCTFPARVSIIDILGNEILYSNISNTGELEVLFDAKNILPGQYFIKINSDNTQQAIKFIKL